MKNYVRKFVLVLVFACVASLAYAQQKPEMADMMRSNGKIYVVVGTLAIVLAGVLGYLVWIDRKIGKLEKK